MAQGKQTSFGNGEVSPEIHFISSSSTYANSLSKLNNGYVRHMGGVSNRQGSEVLHWNPYSADPDFPDVIHVPNGDPTDPDYPKPEAGNDEQIIGYGYWNSVHEVWDTLEIGYFFDIADSKMRKGYRVNYGAIEFFKEDWSPIVTSYDVKALLPEPKEIRFVTVKDKVFITPNFITLEGLTTPTPTMYSYADNYYLDMTTRNIKPSAVPSSGPVVTGSVSAAFSIYGGAAPFFPVSYLVTVTNQNDEEYIIADFGTKGYDPTTWNPAGPLPLLPNIAYPHSGMSNLIDIVLDNDGAATTPMDYCKFVTLYRASGAAGLNGSMYRMVGRSKATNTHVVFTDQGQASAEVTPPIDFSFMVKRVYDDVAFGTNTKYVGQVNAATYYQQRLVTAYKNNKSEAFPSYRFETKAGDMMASRLGSAFQLAKPLFVTETEAFQFAPPISDGSEVVGFLSMERLIALTEKAAYAYMGGDNGVFSPFALNPVKISDTGCSRQVEPKTANSRGYYVSSDHSKIMGVLWNVDGAVKVFEASKNASHLLESGIRKMDLISGKDDLLVVLRRDGVLVTISVNVEGVDADDDKIGFSTFEISNGFVETMYVTKMKKNFVYNQNNTELVSLPHDVIVMYTVRNGDRRIEILRPREDKQPEAFVFSDINVPFGYRLADNGFAGYKKVYTGPQYQTPIQSGPIDFHLNLGDGSTTGWGPEDQIPLYSAESIDSLEKIIFYYGDDMYPKKFTYTLTPSSEAATGLTDFPYKYSGYVNTDVPAAYRDVKNSSMTTAEKNEYWTRWCPAIKEIRSPLLSAIRWGADLVKYPTGVIPVSVYADAQVVSSPDNPHKQNIICYLDRDEFFNLRVLLPEGFDCGWGNVGVPYEFVMTSMRLEASDDATTLQSARKLINAVGVGLKDTQGGFIGIPEFSLEDSQEMLTSPGADFAELPRPVSGYYEWSIPTNFNDHGKISIRHVDPTPLTVLALYPAGVASGG